MTSSFSDISETELYAIAGGWDWKNTVDVAVAVGCVALGCTGPAGVVVSAIISVGYTIGRGL